MKQQVFLHIGHPKTGSSAFQSCLARSHHALEDKGFLYPYHHSFARASRRQVSSGNVSIGPEDQNWLTTAVLPILEGNPNYHTVIFSNENLIHRIADFTATARSLPAHLHFHILLVVRDPIEQLSSVYQQLVKRHGYCKGYEEFLLEHEYRCNATAKAAASIEALEAIEVSYSLFNYSALKTSVIDTLIQAIGIDATIVDRSLPAPVNRSLSATELQLMLFVNAIYGRSVGRILADSLVNQLPDVAPVSLAMQPDSRLKVERENSRHLNFINDRLPAEAQLSLAEKPGFTGDLHWDLCADQLNLSREILTKTLTETNDLTANREWQHHSQRLMTVVSRLLQAQQTKTGLHQSEQRRHQT